MTLGWHDSNTENWASFFFFFPPKHPFISPVCFSSCSASAAASDFPLHYPPQVSGYTSSHQALMPRVKPGRCLSSLLQNADTVSKLSGALLNYSTPERGREREREEKKNKNKTSSGVITRQQQHQGARAAESPSQIPIKRVIYLVCSSYFNTSWLQGVLPVW